MWSPVTTSGDLAQALRRGRAAEPRPRPREQGHGAPPRRTGHEATPPPPQGRTRTLLGASSRRGTWGTFPGALRLLQAGLRGLHRGRRPHGHHPKHHHLSTLHAHGRHQRKPQAECCRPAVWHGRLYHHPVSHRKSPEKLRQGRQAALGRRPEAPDDVAAAHSHGPASPITLPLKRLLRNGEGTARRGKR